METNDTGVGIDHGLDMKAIVRRHLDLPKYLDLLISKKMYFRRADKFSDKLEGVMPAGMRKAIMASGPKDSPHWVDPDTWDRRTRVGNYLNCWNLSSQDNMALWQLYGGASNSVVITSTVGELAATAVRWDRDVFIHKVTYIDHFKSPDMVVGRWHDLLRYKHLAYAFEEEIRFVVPQQGPGWQGNPEELRLPVENLNSLIRSVVVAPEAKPWFFDLVMDVTRKYGVTKPVRRSKLSFMPK